MQEGDPLLRSTLSMFVCWVVRARARPLQFVCMCICVRARVWSEGDRGGGGGGEPLPWVLSLPVQQKPLLRYLF